MSQPYDQVAPRAPQNFTIKMGVRSAELSWNENFENDIFSYLLYLRTNDQSDQEPIFIGKKDNYLLEDLNPEKKYYISLAAQDTSKNIGAKTNEITFSPYDDSPMNYAVAGWMQASADLEDARRSFQENADVFTSLSPFWYSAQGDGSIEKKGNIIDEDTARISQENGVSIIPTITNNFDQDDKLTELLKNSDATNRHIDNIVNEVLANDYDGIDIDYENLGKEVKDNFTYFIKDLAGKLHENNKQLSVTVQAKNSDSNFWDGAGAVNFKKIGTDVDQFRVMTYDYSRLNTDPGPISPLYWFEEVLQYAKTKVPAEKIMAGIPTYAYQWCTSDTEGCESKGLTWDGVQNIISRYDPVLEWNETAQSPWFLYVDDNNNTKIVYYENHQSIEKKLEKVKELEIGGIAIWRLGSEDLQNFEIMRDKLGKKTSAPRGIQVHPLDEAIHISWDFSEDSSVKGYRLFIKEKAEINVDEGDDIKNLSAEELIEKIKSGEYQYSDSIGEWEQEYIDLFDKNEYTIENLENGKNYYLSLMTLSWEDSLHGQVLAEEEEIARTSPEVVATPSDQYFPGTIEDLTATDAKSTSVDLSWTSVGDDYLNGTAEQFDIRYSEDELNSNNFSEAQRFENTPQPLESGEELEWQAGGLEPGRTYYIAMKSIDEAGNQSELSNVVTVSTIDNIAPSIPQNIEASALDSEIFVKWEQSPEEDVAGYKIFYKKESGYYAVVDLKSTESHYSITGIDNGYNYYIGMSVYDVRGNESVRSEDIKVELTGDKSATHYKNTLDKYYEKMKASVVSFSKKLFNDRAVPFIVVLSVLVVNFFIYQGIKHEINRKSNTSSQAEFQVEKTKSGRVVDLKNYRKKY